MTPDTGSPAPTETEGNKPATEESAQVPITETDNAEVRNHLGIPDEVWDQITPKSEESTEESGVQPSQPPTKKEEEPQPEPVTAEKEEAEPETEEDEEEDDEHEEPKPDEKPDKRQKRINRLTRQKKDALKEVETLKAELAKFQAEAEKKEKPKEIVPVSDEESEAGKQLSDAENAIAWCEANPEGGTTKQGDKDVFLDADEVSRLKRFSEKEVLRLTPEIAIAKRDARQRYQVEKTQFDELARQEWSEMFDKSKEDYQMAQIIKAQFPAIAQHPRGNYAVGLAIEGIKALHARKNQKSNGEKKHRDISERAFEPRVPIAPSSANPPSRNERPSPTKKYDQAMTRLTQEGGRENLVAALAAMDETQPKTTSKGHRLVET